MGPLTSFLIKPIGAVAYQTICVVVITYLAWFSLIQRYSASRLSIFTFLAPLFGVAAGHFVMGDVITPAFAVATSFVIAGRGDRGTTAATPRRATASS